MRYRADMASMTWNPDKNAELQRERGISFEDVVVAVASDRVLADIPHPNPRRYPGQRLLIVTIDNYAYEVPYVPSEEEFFLKTIFPSRKATRVYLRKERT